MWAEHLGCAAGDFIQGGNCRGRGAAQVAAKPDEIRRLCGHFSSYGDIDGAELRVPLKAGDARYGIRYLFVGVPLNQVTATGLNKIAVSIHSKVACTGVKRLPSVANHKKTLALNGHIRTVARALRASLSVYRLNRPDFDSQSDLHRIDTADRDAVIRSTGSLHRLINHILEVNHVAFKACGINIGNVITRNVKISLVCLYAANCGV